MSYFKLFFSILKSHKINIILPLLIVMIASVIIVNSINESISSYAPDVYIVDKDNTEFSKELVSEIDKHTDIKTYVGNEDIEEELMKSWISLYIEIPEGFSNSFNEYKNSEENKFKIKNKVIIKSIENSNSRVFIEEKINNYLNSKLNDTDIISNDFIKLDISSAITTDNTTAKITAIGFAAYGVIYGVSSVIGTFFMLLRKKELKDRYTCGPVSNKQYLLQIILAYACLTVVFSLVIAIFILNILFNIPFDIIWLLNYLNILLMAILGLGIGLIFGLFIKNMETLTGLSTGISLAIAFLGGLFVPIEIFSDTMRKFALFTPGYWYQKVNTMLNSGANNIDTTTLLTSFGIQGIFIIATFVVVAIIHKKKK